MNKKFLYIIQSELMPAYCKIGISDDVEKRVGDIYGEWCIRKKIELEDPAYYEQKVKSRLRDLRASGNELFNCPVAYLTRIVLEEIKAVRKEELPPSKLAMPFNIANLGALVKSTRKKQKLTQEQLAGAAGTGVRFIVELEKGKPTAEVGLVLRIFEMLGLKLFLTD